MADIGTFALVIALLTSVYALAAYIIGLQKNEEPLLASAKGGVFATAIFTTIASISLIYLLMTGDFSIQYVASYTSSDLPPFYKLSAFWAGNNGSLLLWAWILTILAAIVTVGRRDEDLKPYVGAVMMLISAFFLFLIINTSNPFVKLPKPLLEGNGLNPMLQNPGMVIHPVTTYLGYVGFTVPFAYAIAALFTRQADDRWIKVTRKWTIMSWLFLSMGNLFGAQWAYVELGWGGYWAWDPVENASLIPWLMSTAFLHSVMVQERKNMLKIWNMLLIIFTFALTLFGTFLVRSGVVASVHAFGNSTLGLYFIVFTTVVTMGSLYLVLDRIGLLKQGNEFESLISKESSFLLNNLLFVASAFSILWGTIFPIVSEGFTGRKITVGAPFFNAINAPIGLAFVLLMGICPLIAWRKASIKGIVRNFRVPLVVLGLTGLTLIVVGIRKPYAVIAFSICAFVIVSTLQDIVKGIRVRHKMTGEGWLISSYRLLTKNRRRYGGYVIHLGVVMMIIGIAGSNIYNQEFTKTLKAGEQVRVDNYLVTYEGLQQKPKGENMVISADLNISKSDSLKFKLSPEKVFYPTTEQPSTEPAVKSTWKEDFYVTLVGWEDEAVTIKVNINPLIKWLWTGGYVLILGTLFALWPGKGSAVGAKYLGRS
ncbi:cytochrome c biogenesis factor [Desulfitobacterium dichloroeliminans LMG P-21439]|uniref:Cytochrome c biogenesis factor n=1 Tax=Desulfitobacterium dichloroeliminans (strain LMG P-21439 / DCA1) TaxID=871963 RepID=L0F6I3_DESDL|nr:heme lyase CcmF/NrfE family subunit [Desulfitobacterium dichloroeliminans]AGA68630.1 cytochrome c biogenesis factor [Desulfitobacterium dichloroeliminans LMG P-21439]